MIPFAVTTRSRLARPAAVFLDAFAVAPLLRVLIAAETFKRCVILMDRFGVDVVEFVM
jgi:hypothetical protein